VGEGEHVQEADPREGHEDDEAGPHEVAGHHDDTAVQAVGQHSSHRGGEDGGEETQDQHHGHGRLVAGQGERLGDERERGDPVPYARDGLTDQEPAKPSGSKERPGAGLATLGHSK
jgi:hypothetical protein